MNIFEALAKPFLKTKKDDFDKNSTNPEPDRIDFKIADQSEVPIGFFDGNTDSVFNSLYTQKDSLEKALNIQKDWIITFRKISAMPEVANAISEIVDEATFSGGKEDAFYLEFEADVSENIKNKFNEDFENILQKLNIKRNLYSLFAKFYIDGQLNVHCSYNKNTNKRGILSLKILDPIYLYYDFSKNKWIYHKEKDNNNFYNMNNRPSILDQNVYDTEFSREEVVRIDSGIYEDKIILSDLYPAVKTANMLQTLEEMLIPMRFSRSVSRRVFNIDVANMNAKKAEEFIKKLQDRFKYKKFYDVKSGTISNQQHIASLTEDYWFPNRNGTKGTTVDTIDETGNLGETGDLDYFRKKLYGALKVPTNRLLGSEDRAEFDFTSTNISREEVKFFNFITRKRSQFSELLIELLKRQMISTKVITEEEFNKISKNLKVVWRAENKFFERMQDEIYNSAVSMFTTFEELANKNWVSKEFVYKKVLKFSQEEIEEIQKQIKSEKTDKLYKDVKVGDGFDDGGGFEDGGNQFGSQEKQDDNDEKEDVEDVENTDDENEKDDEK